MVLLWAWRETVKFIGNSQSCFESITFMRELSARTKRQRERKRERSIKIKRRPLGSQFPWAERRLRKKLISNMSHFL
jgi:hypothetical protein